MPQSIRTEFPDYDVSTLPAIPAHWEDHSYCHDACPSWSVDHRDGGEARLIYIDYADPAHRDASGACRYTVVHTTDWGVVIDSAPTLHTDSWDEVLAYLADF